MIKLLMVIFNDEKKLKSLFKKYKLTFNTMTYGLGTAPSAILDYLGLADVRKSIYFSLIPDTLEENFLKELKTKLKIKEAGRGIALTISLNSSNKYVKDLLPKGSDKVEKVENDYELIMTIVKEGYRDTVMQAAKKVGATGGTLIEGRSLGSSRTVFMDLAIEPEKDIVLNIVDKKIARKVMESITKEAGIKTEAHGLTFSLPIDRVIGLQDEKD